MASKIFKLALWLWMLCSVQACVTEPYAECPSLRLHFYFTLHTEHGNLFGREVHALKVCFFGMDSVLRHVEAVEGDFSNDYVMPISLTQGSYYVIVWASQTTMPERSFKSVTLKDTLGPIYDRGLAIGQTTMEQMRLMLQYRQDEQNPQVLAPLREPIDDLFYGALGRRRKGSSVYAIDTITLIDDHVLDREIELIRNTNIIDITIEGVNYLRALTQDTGDIVKISLTAANERNDYANAFDESTRECLYQAVTLQDEPEMVHAQVHTMRLDLYKHQRQPIMLRINSLLDAKSKLIPDINLIKTLLQARDSATGAFVYQTQEDFDRIYIHPIRIVIAPDLRVSIVIHDWIITPVIPKPIQRSRANDSPKKTYSNT